MLAGLLNEHLHSGENDGFKAHLLIEGVTYVRSIDRHRRHASGGEDLVFRHCVFEKMTCWGSISSTFVGCSFEDSEWHEASFTSAIFIRTEFDACVFRDTSFYSCIFVECEFVNCKFLPNALGRECSFDETRWHACSTHQCVGLEGVVCEP